MNHDINVMQSQKIICEYNNCFLDKEVIYIEGKFNNNINNLIETNYKIIKESFAKAGFDFIYIPYILKYDEFNLSKMSELFYFYLPWSDEYTLTQILKNLSVLDIYNAIYELLDYKGERYSGFIRYYDQPGVLEFAEEFYTYSKIDDNEQQEFMNQIIFFINAITNTNLYQEPPLFSLLDAKTNKLAPADEEDEREIDFDYEEQIAIRELIKNIKLLKSNGNYNTLLNIIAHSLNRTEKQTLRNCLLEKVNIESEKNKISKIVITKDYKIFLPDYNNIEIHLTPLHKALYIFFLKIEYKIELNDLWQFKDEILEIYKHLTLRENYDAILTSVSSLVNQASKKSLLEKLSRIKHTFLLHMEDSIAKNYYIVGSRKSLYGIDLDKKMIQFEFDASLFPEPTKKLAIDDINVQHDEIIVVLSKATNAIKYKRYTKAIQMIDRMLNKIPNHYIYYHDCPYNKLGIAYFNLGDYHNANIYLTKAIVEQTNTTEAYHNRAELYLLMGKLDEALQDITIYLKYVDNKCKLSYHLRGLIYMELDNIKAACQDWFNAKSLNHFKSRLYYKRYNFGNKYNITSTTFEEIK